MNKPHVHAELIKKWADGAEIQYLYIPTDGTASVWLTVPKPTWSENTKYRVKPEPESSMTDGDLLFAAYQKELDANGYRTLSAVLRRVADEAVRQYVKENVKS